MARALPPLCGSLGRSAPRSHSTVQGEEPFKRVRRVVGREIFDPCRSTRTDERTDSIRHVGMGSGSTQGYLDLHSEDRFAIVDMEATDHLFIDSLQLKNFCAAVAGSSRWMPTFDLRGVDDVYEDVRDALVETLTGIKSAIILCDPALREEVEGLLAHRSWWERRGAGVVRVVSMKRAPLPIYRLDMSAFAEYADVDRDTFVGAAHNLMRSHLDAQLAVADELGYVVPELSKSQIAELERDLQAIPEFDAYEEPYYRDVDLRSTFVDRVLTWINRQSLLSQVVISDDGERLHVHGHHSHSLHYVEELGELVQPSRVDRRWNRTHARTIAQFEELINTPGVHESELERFLVNHPLFLRGLNYSDVYTQLVLPGNQPGLRPDLFVSAVGSAFADIIELKRADTALVVHRGSSTEQFSEAVRDAISQLHSYREYFNDPANVEEFEKRYARFGLRCYRPRLVAIVGRAPSTADEATLRRLITRQPEIEVLPWDRLLQVARNHLLL